MNSNSSPTRPVVSDPDRGRLAGVALMLALLAGPSVVGQALAAEETRTLARDRAQALGVEWATLEPARTARIEGLPAQVVVPNAALRAVSAPLAGLVTHVTVAVGDPVRKGQVLAQILSPTVAELQRGILQADSQERLAASTLARERSLLAEGIIPEARVLLAQGRLEEARAQTEERVQAARLAGVSDETLARLRAGERVESAVPVSAPIDGVVLEQMVTTGERLDLSAPLFKLARTDQLALEIRAPRARLAAVRRGAEVEVEAGVARARVVAVAASVSADNQTLMLRAEVTRGASALRPGEYVQASVAATPSAEGPVWAVPNAAIARVAGRAHVFVETPGGVQARVVRLDTEGLETTRIRGTLAPATRIAVRGVAALKAALLGAETD